MRGLITLRKLGIIKKISTGTWEIVPEKQGDISYPMTPTHTPHLPDILRPDNIRTHAVRVTLKIPKLAGWNSRGPRLRKLGLEYKAIPQGQRIVFRGMKVWLCTHSIVMFLPESWFGETAAENMAKVTSDVMELCHALESTLRASSLKIDGGYKLKFSPQPHHALIKNALAKEYNDNGKKLRVLDDSGLWLLIDDSLKLDELETVHPKTSTDDSKVIQDFFNKVKHGYFEEWEAMQLKQAEILIEYGRQLNVHIPALKGMKKITDRLDKLLLQKKVGEYLK